VSKGPKNPSAKSGGNKPLPPVNVEFARSGDAMTPDRMRALICNPIYAGLGRYPALVSDEEWVRAAAQMIHKEGSEQFLVNLLYVLRQSFDAGDP
jgi:hypothetical protein